MVRAGGVRGLASDGSLRGGYRWDAAPRNYTFTGKTVERSLDGGLRYSVQGGSWQSFRDLFTWNSLPSVDAFSSAVQTAFDAWSSPDPVTGLTSPLRFVPDLGTAVVGSSGGPSALGAEIDLFGATSATTWTTGNTGLQGLTYTFGGGSTSITLTSGVSYSSTVIVGSDIYLNCNPGAVWSLDLFRRLLTHEIGHTIGLLDDESNVAGANTFVDDNYDASSSARALATLTNSWTALVDPYNPAGSPLRRYTVTSGDPGLGTAGVNLLMESNGTGLPGNPLSSLVPLTNDEYGTRQFLYPSVTYVPEAGVSGMAVVAMVVMMRRRRS
jgi:hypothetical protein